MVGRVVHEVAHHFDSADQEFDACKLGMWVFLVTEVLLFGGLFVGYCVFRAWYPEMFIEASKLLDWRLGALNTVVLLCSSLTMVLGVRAAQTDNQKALKRNLILTIALAGCFMVVKYIEYSGKYAHGLFPGDYFQPQQTFEAANINLFFSFYFVMTGIHGIHVLIGMIALGWVYWHAAKGKFYPDYYTPVEVTGLYWHVVDLIWIYLFPLMYLI